MSRVADARVAVTADGRLVADTDPDAVSLVAGVGGVIPDEYDDQPLPGEKPAEVVAQPVAKARGRATAKATDSPAEPAAE